MIKKMLAVFGITIYFFSITVVSAQSYLPEKNNAKIKIQPAIGLKAYAFNLKDVKLTEGSVFKHAMGIDAGYMLALKPDRLLYRFYKNAGLPVKDSRLFPGDRSVYEM